MIIRHQRILQHAHDLPRQPVSAAGWFWVAYVAAVVLIALWVLA